MYLDNLRKGKIKEHCQECKGYLDKEGYRQFHKTGKKHCSSCRNFLNKYGKEN